jgi:hypothetical protein
MFQKFSRKIFAGVLSRRLRRILARFSKPINWWAHQAPIMLVAKGAPIPAPQRPAIAALERNTMRRQSLSARIRIGWPSAINSSAFRCLELLSCPASLRTSSSPTTSRVVCLVTPPSTRHPAPAAESAAIRLGIDNVPVNTSTSPDSGPSALPSRRIEFMPIRVPRRPKIDLPK